MAKKAPAIPEQAKYEALAAVESFNQANKTEYVLTFKGKYAYLSRFAKHGNEKALIETVSKLMDPRLAKLFASKTVETKIGRLTWSESRWDFAPFLYSSETYDTSGEARFMMPGAKLLDGTIEGAMKAGLQLYP
jgi:hypothetical protein